MQTLWDCLAFSKLIWDATTNATKFITYQDFQRIIQFLMALRNKFESIRALLLHCLPLLTLESAITKLLSKETRLAMFKHSLVKTVMVTPRHLPLHPFVAITINLGISSMNVPPNVIRSITKQDTLLKIVHKIIKVLSPHNNQKAVLF